MAGNHAQDDVHACLLAMAAFLDGFVDRLGETVRTTVREAVEAAFAKERETKPQAGEGTDERGRTRGNMVDDVERDKARSALRNPLVLPSVKEGQGLIDAKALARFLDVSYRCLYRLMAEGALPASVTLGGRMKRWQLEEIMAWVFHGCPPGDKWRPIRTRAMREYREAIRERGS